MSDSLITPGGAVGSNPQSRFGTYRSTVAEDDPITGGVVSIDPGNPVSPINPTGGSGSGTGGGTGVIQIYLARGNNGSGQGSQVLGLALSAGEFPGNASYVAGPGPLTLPTTQWDSIVPGESGGLVTGDIYYVGATPGTLSNAPPSGAGDAVIPVGFALSPTTMWVQIGMSDVTQFADNATINAGATAAVVIAIPTYFGRAGTGTGTAHMTLANGKYDGQEVTVHFTGNAEVDGDLTPASFGDGAKITFSAGAPYAGAATLEWSAVDGKWWIVSDYQATVS